MGLKIKDLWIDGKNIIEDLNLSLPSEVTSSIQSLQPTFVTSVEDCWVWSENLSGEYTTRSGFHWLSFANQDHGSGGHWNWIWKLPLAASVQFFMWQVCHKSLPTKSALQHRGVNVYPTCPYCVEKTKTITHCFAHELCLFGVHAAFLISLQGFLKMTI